MGSYRSDGEALIGLARQLTDAYGEARTREDQDYACDSIAEYLAEFRDAAPSEALLAILDLPLTGETYPLVDEAQVALAARGPDAVELLLEAVLGDVYDPDGPAPERAAETLEMMDPSLASRALCEVLCGRGDGQVKSAALDALVALGGVAEPDLTVALDDPVGGEWALAALEQLRLDRVQGQAAEEEPVTQDKPAADDVKAPGDLTEGAEDVAHSETASPQPGPGPDQGLVDDAYDDFLRRFEQGAGGEPSP